jgi:hypothetical protein
MQLLSTVSPGMAGSGVRAAQEGLRSAPEAEVLGSPSGFRYTAICLKLVDTRPACESACSPAAETHRSPCSSSSYRTRSISTFSRTRTSSTSNALPGAPGLGKFLGRNG